MQSIILIICILAVFQVINSTTTVSTTTTSTIDERDVESFDFNGIDERLLASYSKKELEEMYRRGDPRVIRRRIVPTKKPTNKRKPTTPTKPTPAKPTKPTKPTTPTKPTKPTTPTKPTKPTTPAMKIVYRELFKDSNCGKGMHYFIYNIFHQY